MHIVIGRIRFMRTRIEPWNVVASPLGCTSQQARCERLLRICNFTSTTTSSFRVYLQFLLPSAPGKEGQFPTQSL